MQQCWIDPVRGARGWVAAIAVAVTAWVGAPAFAAGNTVVIEKRSDARSFDPHRVIEVNAGELLPMLTDTLIAVQDDFKTLDPLLAKSWKVSADRKTYTFELRNDVSFCSGRKFTAADVEATFTRWLAPETKSGNLVVVGPLASVKATGPHTVQFTLKTPYADFLTQLAQPYAGIINIEQVKALGERFGTAGLDGTGPYCWDYWRPREEISIKRHAAYKWAPKGYSNPGPVKVDGLLLKIIPEDNSRISALLKGEGDISYVIPASAMSQFKAQPAIFGTAEPRAFGWVAFIGTKVHRPLMADPAVRKALNMAVDRKLLVEALYYHQARVADFVVTPVSPGYSNKVEALSAKYDVAAANKLLDDAGWKKGADGVRVKNGLRLAPVVIGYTAWRETLEAVQGMAREIGMEMKLEIADIAVTVSRVTTKDDFDMWGYYGSYVSTGELLNKYFLADQPLAPYRFVPEKGAPIDTLVRAGRDATSEDIKTANYDKAQLLVAEAQYWVPLVHERMQVVYNKKRVKGVLAHGLTGNGLYKAIDLDIVR